MILRNIFTLKKNRFFENSGSKSPLKFSDDLNNLQLKNFKIFKGVEADQIALILR